MPTPSFLLKITQCKTECPGLPSYLLINTQRQHRSPVGTINLQSHNANTECLGHCESCANAESCDVCAAPHALSAAKDACVESCSPGEYLATRTECACMCAIDTSHFLFRLHSRSQPPSYSFSIRALSPLPSPFPLSVLLVFSLHSLSLAFVLLTQPPTCFLFSVLSSARSDLIFLPPSPHTYLSFSKSRVVCTLPHVYTLICTTVCYFALLTPMQLIVLLRIYPHVTFSKPNA